MLKPLWQTRQETANRLRGRCERVWDFAKARAHCSGENPFRWRGHLDKLLPKRAHLTRGHHKAMPFAEVPAFVGRLQAMQGVAPQALEFAILTAGRSGEVLGARWDEIDLEQGVDRAGASHEGREGTPGASFGPRHVNPRGAAPGGGVGFCVSWLQARRPAQQHGPGSGASPRAGRCHDARFPLVLPRLGRRQHAVCPRRGGGRAGARHREQDRGRLSSQRCARETPQADGGMGGILCVCAERAQGNVTPLRRV